MQKINESHVFTGMQRDVSVSKQPMQFLYEARNIRLTAREGDTLFSITNEKGPGGTDISIEGDYVGHCLLNNYLVIFSTGSGKSTITRIDLDNISPDSQQGVIVLYSGALGFGDHIEAIASYENDGVQKIYWTDGYNQPRVINIADSRIADRGNDSSDYTPFNAESFDFIRKLKLKEEVSVEKLLGASGMFAPGVIQYAFTYFNKYGQETNIFYTTPLLYVSHKDRGASPEDKVDNAFKIKLKNVDSVFEFLRVYSIERTSIDATPYCRRVIDVSLEGITGNEVTVIDTGTIGDTIDPTELLYKGGESIVAETLEQKDNTLFLGNLKISRESVASFKEAVQKNTGVISGYRYFQPLKISKGSYNYSNQLTSVEVTAEPAENPTTYSPNKEKSVPCAGFKRGDYYRLGVQFQHNTGKWSDPIFLNDYMQNNSPEELIEDNIIKTPIFKGTIKDDENYQPIDKLVEAGYLKVRAVAVYPTPQDRVVVCQGVSNPTLRFPLEKDDLGEDYPRKTWSSWFFRPIYKAYETTEGGVTKGYYSIRKDGSATPSFAAVNTTNTVLEYTNNNLSSTAETVGDTTVYHPVYNPINIRRTEIQGDFEPENKLYINYKYNTLHSPDIEFDDSLSVFNFTGLNARKIGKIAFTKTLADIDIQTETPAAHNLSGGFIHKFFVEPYSAGIVAGLFYEDFYLNDEDNGGDITIETVDEQKKPFKWMVYPWQKNGSLNNDFNRPVDKGIQTALLKKKVISNLRYANSFYDDINSENDFTPKAIQLFSSNEVSLLRFDDAYYMGNIDTLLSADNVEGQYFAFDGEMSLDHNISDSDTAFNSNHWHKTFSISDSSPQNEGLYKFDVENLIWNRVNNRSGEDYLQLVINKAQVRIKYKSTPHLVVSVNEDGNDWKYMYDIPDMKKDRYSTLSIIEIIRPGDTGDNSDKPYYRSTMFGGTSEDAIRANKWIPCGEPVSLVDDNGNTKQYVDFEYSYGDTYYQRWDCLKTYPFTHEDPNQIVEIGSFMLETHVNIDGRYDRNRGQLNNLNMSPQNFNLLNPIYSQMNNFFSYRILDADYYKNNIFPNQITWTKEKQAGADVDLWTNITLANTYDMDGSKGEVISLNTWKDNIFCFQPKGVSTILFNSRVQIPASDGVPIEITNNYKVDGYRYIGDGIGCKNKWTIKETPSGVYFIDSISKHLFTIGEGLQDISASHNMALWFKQNDIDKTLYDEVNHDIYLVNKKESLCYSEILSQFTAFMDYKDIKLIESYNNKIFTLKNPPDKLKNPTNAFYLYQMFEGAPCDFFGETCPWSITFISNGFDNSFSGADKIFTNIEFRTTVDSETKDEDAYTDYLPLDYIYAENDYQTSEETGLVFEPDEASNLKRKFRIWRCDIPRAKGGFNRLRNPWLKITLKKNATNSMKATELHDLIVNYYV